jgi:hypothetical protein
VGAVNVTEADVAPATVADPIVGADGTDGAKVFIGAEVGEASDAPIAFVAVTRNLYVVEGSNPVTT